MSAHCLEINCTSAQFMFLALITYYLTYLDKYLLDSKFHNADIELRTSLRTRSPFHKSFPGTKKESLYPES